MKAIISPNIRTRYPELFEVGPYSIVDDFCYFSTRVRIGTCYHVAAGCTVAGGRKMLFSIGDFCSLSSGAKVWCTSNDFANDVITILPEGCEDIGTEPIEGDVIIENYCGIGANTVVMPNNRLPEGAAVGALSFVPPAFRFEPWSVYAGIPVRWVKPRNKERVLSQVRRMKERLGLCEG
jgi:acetyltransferase-like isoleucine patch superfamily enzyme